MKTFHVHLKVRDLKESTAFYSALFASEPSIQKEDYAKWALKDPNVNFAISTGNTEAGIEHLGIQVESEEELHQVYANLEKAKGEIFEEGDCTCCYSKSKKSWIKDPQGVEWETFYTYGTSTVYGKGQEAIATTEEKKTETSSCGSSCGVPEEK